MDIYSSPFFSFGKYGFVSFQTQTNYMICTKVEDKIGCLELKFAIIHLPYIIIIFFCKTNNLWGA